MASLSVIKGTFRSDEPIKRASESLSPLTCSPAFLPGSEKNVWQITAGSADSRPLTPDIFTMHVQISLISDNSTLKNDEPAFKFVVITAAAAKMWRYYKGY